MEMSDSRRKTFVCMIECMRYEYETVVNEIVEVQMRCTEKVIDVEMMNVKI